MANKNQRQEIKYFVDKIVKD
ncbi:MAG: hypothetical protein PWP30_1538, partial [Eubacteriaceae bacterium]|nr:hypothetical protein [Eubacteriaceae bacterium]